MSVRVVTLSRQLGSGGDELATHLAERLGWKRMDRDIIEKAARSSGAPDAALAALDEFDLFSLKPSSASRKAYRQGVERVVRQAAKEGHVVLVGRAGQVILGQQPEALHVKVVSPPELRVRRIMAATGIDEAAALNRLMASDRSRALYLRQGYGVDWLNPLLYDLVLNIKTMDLDWAVALLLQAIQGRK